MTRPSSAITDLSRRHFLWQSASGLGAVALAWLLDDEARAQEKHSVASASPYSAKPTHFPARAKRVIHIFAAGGVSHVDTFDYKPDLIKHHGQPLTAKTKYDPFFGQPGNLLKSPWAFRQHGTSGQWVSDLAQSSRTESGTLLTTAPMRLSSAICFG